MKKYVKPELFFESFQLSQNIAACGYDMNQADKDSCTSEGDTKGEIFANVIGVTYFADSNGSCDKEPEYYCYTNGTDEQFKMFNS